VSRVLGLYAAAAYAFLHLPLGVLALFSFNRSRVSVWEGFSLRWYAAAFQDRQMIEAAANSLAIGVAATLLATLVGTLAAYALWKKNSTWLASGLVASLVTPEIVMGIALLSAYQWAFRFLGLRLGFHTVILAHVLFCTAYVVTVVLARLRSFDASLEEAAMDLGATPWAAFREVTLPALWPGIAAAALLAFTISFDDYVITSLVAGVDTETLPMVLYAVARRGGNPAVNAISTVVVFVLGLLIFASEQLQEKR
jgi:spermidine/putrescine transport system permease protein